MNVFTPACARRTLLSGITRRCLQQTSRKSSTSTSTQTQSSRLNQSALAFGCSAALLAAWQWQNSKIVSAEEPPKDEIPDLVFEKPRKQGSSKQENRDIISSQHLQVKRSWENPGLYAWGSNSGRVAAPDSDEKFIKTAQRIAWFDGVLLRDVKLDRNFGAAITENGDLLQWGTGYAPDCRNPIKTLAGKNLTSLTISRDRIIALSKNGTVYSLAVSAAEQAEGPKPSESSWIPFWSGTSRISYRKFEPQDLKYGEKVTEVAAGLSHVLLLTNKGRVFSAAAASDEFPRHGQLGIPGLTWQTRPAGPSNQCHEITALRGFDIAKLAAGDYHSLVSDVDGRMFSFGDNSYGQLGVDFNTDNSIVDHPTLLPMQKLYAGTNQTPKVTGVAAGGTNSYFTVDATKIASQTDEPAAVRRLGLVTSDVWSCGQGIYGTLGNGRWTHVQPIPARIQALSGLYEYDEKDKVTVPIRLSRLSVGQNHVSAVMDNIAHVGVGLNESGGRNDTNWGADILFFGNNEFYQIGNGKRNNVNMPIYIQPLDQVAERKIRGKEEHRFHLTPKKNVKINGRWVDLEQRVECGRGVTAVYSGV